MITSDIHMHSAFSSDSESSMESMIEGAIEKGLKTICFTEHLDYEYPPEDGKVIFEVDLDAYQKKNKGITGCLQKANRGFIWDRIWSDAPSGRQI